MFKRVVSTRLYLSKILDKTQHCIQLLVKPLYLNSISTLFFFVFILGLITIDLEVHGVHAKPSRRGSRNGSRSTLAESTASPESSHRYKNNNKNNQKKKMQNSMLRSVIPTRVPRGGVRGAANSYNSLILIPI